jgi:hypothetical protein
MAAWNAAPPGRFQDKLGLVLDKGTALQSIATYTGVALAAGIASRYGCGGDAQRRATTPPRQKRSRGPVPRAAEGGQRPALMR